jgi:hypothetical protein
MPSFHAVFKDWAMDGSFHYKNGVSYSGEVHSKDLRLNGLASTVPRMSRVKVDGTLAMNFTCSQILNKPQSFKTNGQLVLKKVSIALPNEPYLGDLNTTINITESTVKIPTATFGGFDGTGTAAFSMTFGKVVAYNYSFNLKNVNAQKAINRSIEVYVEKNQKDYKDKLYGTMNMVYSGSGKGLSGDSMMASQTGSGTYNIVAAKVKGYAAISAMNSFFKEKSDEIKFEKIDGNLGLKNSVMSYTANTLDKVGTIRVAGAINLMNMVYAPDMKVRCDVKKEFLDSDAVRGQIPAQYRSAFNIGLAADKNGMVPVDFRFTGPVKKMPGLDCLDASRLLNNVINNLVQEKAKDLGGALKGLFGK